MRFLLNCLLLLSAIAAQPCHAAAAVQRRLAIIDQDSSGPGGSNTMSTMVMLQSPQVQVLGITIVTGNAWRDDEAKHALRMLELIGRSDVPVALGAVFPLLRTEEETRLMVPVNGQVGWLGAWGQKPAGLKAPTAGLVEVPPPPKGLGPWDTPPLQEGEPRRLPASTRDAHD
jgi:hypothetical protein